MDLFGIGVDIIKNSRIKKMIKKKILLKEYFLGMKFYVQKKALIKQIFLLKDMLPKKHFQNHWALVLEIILNLRT